MTSGVMATAIQKGRNSIKLCFRRAHKQTYRQNIRKQLSCSSRVQLSHLHPSDRPSSLHQNANQTAVQLRYNNKLLGCDDEVVKRASFVVQVWGNVFHPRPEVPQNLILQVGGLSRAEAQEVERPTQRAGLLPSAAEPAMANRGFSITKPAFL